MSSLAQLDLTRGVPALFGAIGKPALGLALAFLLFSGARAEDSGSKISDEDTSEDMTMEEADASTLEVELSAPDAEVEVLQLMTMQACAHNEADVTTCQTALTFTNDFGNRVSQAIGLDDSLEMSAYDIGAALREQRDLLIEFDALYRATSSLVVRLVDLRAADRAEIASLSAENAALTRELTLAREGQAIALEQLQTSEREVIYLTQLLQEREVELARLRAELAGNLARGEEELVRLRLALSDQEALIAQLRADLDARDQSILALERALAEAIAVRDAHLQALSQEQTGRLAAEEGLSEALAYIATLEAELEALRGEHRALTAALSDQTAQIEALNAIILVLEQENSELSEANTGLIIAMEELTIRLEAAITDRDAARSEWQVAMAAGGESDRDLASANADLMAANEALAAANAQIAELQAIVEDQAAQIAALTAEIAALSDQIGTSQGDTESLMQELMLRDQTIAILQENLATAQIIISTLEADLMAALEREAALTDQLAVLEGQLANLQDQLLARDAAIADLQERLSLAQGQLDAQASNGAEAGAALLNAQNQNAALEADLAAKDARIAELEAALAEAQEEDTAPEPVTPPVAPEEAPEAHAADNGDLAALQAEPYVRVEQMAAWLTAKMVGREDQTAIEFEPRRFSLLQDLLFDTNSADLKPEGEQELTRLARILEELESNPNVREEVLLNGYDLPVDWVLQVGGHADPRPINGGPYADNWELASQRALTVLRYLAEQGVPESRLRATSFGSEKPVSGQEDNDDLNRRISFTVGIR